MYVQIEYGDDDGNNSTDGVVWFDGNQTQFDTFVFFFSIYLFLLIAFCF